MSDARPKATVNSIFRDYKDDYISNSGKFISFEQQKVLHSLSVCRTGFLGYRIQKCDSCNTEIYLDNSCRNRHCPLCQNLKREEWLLARKSELLPGKYFHVVFTIPHKLIFLFYCNQFELYSLLFKIASQTLKEFGNDQKSLGARIGFLMILHTWGQQLTYHPHIHTLVTAGGLSNDKSEWIDTKYKDILFDVKKLSEKFKENFLKALMKRFNNKKLEHLYFPDDYQDLNDFDNFKNFLDNLSYRDWVVFSRAPGSENFSVVDYLARYAYRVAIANSRIIKVEDDIVYFSYKDYRDDKVKTLDLPVFDFIQRFLMHALPNRFQKIRYYGILGNNQKKENIKILRKLFSLEYDAAQSVFDHINAQENPLETHSDFFKIKSNLHKCPNCSNGKLKTILITTPFLHGTFKTIKTKYYEILTLKKRGP
jgi:hypothetical protein